MSGFLLIDKPEGMTSHDVVSRIRRLAGEKRVGHAGTLDPFATGLLIVGVGRVATREFSKLVGLDKEYEAEFVLGATSDTDDRTGVIASSEGARQSTERLLRSARNDEVANHITDTVKQFTGPIQQIPCTYSAIKINGKKMYEAARAGKPLEAKPRSVTVYSFELIESIQDDAGSRDPAYIRFRIHCSSGTYIRALARDLGQILKTGGYVQELRRTAVGPFRIEQSTALRDLTPETIQQAILPIETILSQIPSSATVSS